MLSAIRGTLLLLFVSLAQATEPVLDGKLLVDTHCQRCHGSDIYLRPARTVQSLPDLERRVRHCELALNLTWFDDQIASVVGYLNDTYYHFK